MNARVALAATAVLAAATFAPRFEAAACDGNEEQPPPARIAYDEASDAPYESSPILRFDLDEAGAVFPPFRVRSTPPCDGDRTLHWALQTHDAASPNAPIRFLRAPHEAGRYTLRAFPVAPGRERAQAELDVFDVLRLDAGHWAAFDASGALHVVADAGNADLYISKDAALEFPGGGVALTDGDDGGGLPPGARRAKPFTELEPSAWRDDRTELTHAELRRDLEACPSSTGCSDMAARVLLIHTRAHTTVKLRIRSVDPFVAAFEATGPGATFRY